MRNFLSKDGKHILTVLYAEESNLKICAENEKFPKALNLEFSDILSLEPVDSSLRPYRIHNFIWMNDWDYEEVE